MGTHTRIVTLLFYTDFVTEGCLLFLLFDSPIALKFGGLMFKYKFSRTGIFVSGIL